MPIYICYQFCGRLSSFCGGLFIVCGGFCICGRDKSVHYSCEQIAITLLTDWNNACRTGRKLSTFAHEIRCEHTVRRRGRFIVPVYFCYQFCGYLTSFCGCIFIICGGACAISWEFWYMRAR